MTQRNEMSAKALLKEIKNDETWGNFYSEIEKDGRISLEIPFQQENGFYKMILSDEDETWGIAEIKMLDDTTNPDDFLGIASDIKSFSEWLNKWLF